MAKESKIWMYRNNSNSKILEIKECRISNSRLWCNSSKTVFSNSSTTMLPMVWCNNSRIMWWHNRLFNNSSRCSYMEEHKPRWQSLQIRFKGLECIISNHIKINSKQEIKVNSQIKFKRLAYITSNPIKTNSKQEIKTNNTRCNRMNNSSPSRNIKFSCSLSRLSKTK